MSAQYRLLVRVRKTDEGLAGVELENMVLLRGFGAADSEHMPDVLRDCWGGFIKQLRRVRRIKLDEVLTIVLTVRVSWHRFYDYWHGIYEPEPEFTVVRSKTLRSRVVRWRGR